MMALRALRPAVARRAALFRPPATPRTVPFRFLAAGLSNRYISTINPSTIEPSAVDSSTVKTSVDQLKLRDDQKPLAWYSRYGLSLSGALKQKLKLLPNDKLRNHLPFLWLRDNCRCSRCVNQLTRQRNFDTFRIPSRIYPTGLPAVDEDGVHVTWSDGHESFYDWKFIRSHMTHNSRRPVVPNAGDLTLWSANIAKQPPTVLYDQVMESDAGLAGLTRAIRKFGFVLVKETPYDDPDKTRKLLERIGPIRVTHYGGFYDFIPDMAMADTAYTNLALPAHTDTTYFTEPAGLQAFHLLSHQPAPGAGPDEAAEGGKSLLVDGFRAARIMKRQFPHDYRVLTRFEVPWHASGNEGITIAPDRLYPVLECNKGEGLPFRIRWNNDDRGVLPLPEEEEDRYTTEMWYKAARKWNKILKHEDSELWLQLKPGTTLIFDNWRVLHGRSAFTGIRRICGGYINRDDFYSRYINTNFGRERALELVIG